MEDFAREWSKSVDESRRFIVNLFGLGGIGKSKLLQQFLLRHAQEEMVCKLDANFDDLNDPLAAIKAVLRKTRRDDKQIEFEETQELIARFEKLVNEAAKSSGELPSAITKVLVKGAQVGGELIGGTETGKIVRDVGEATADLMEIGFEKLSSVWRAAKDEKDTKLLDAPIREITDKLIEEINGYCKDDAKFILSIDTHEKISPSVDRWLLKDLLVEHEEQIKFDLRLLIAGREPLTEVNRHWHDEWGGELLAFKIEPFTLEETSALLLQRRDIVDPQIVEKIHNSTRGYPFWLDLWANSGIDPEHFFSAGHLQKIEDRLFEMFPNPKHQNWLRQAAFFYRFNQDLLAILIKDDVDKAFEWLVDQSSLVEGSGKYWKLHDVARKVILTNLHNRSQALLAEPANKILQHFQQQLQNPWEKWRDLRLRLKLSEQDLQVISEINYYQALARAEIIDDHLDMIIRILDSKVGFARNLFNLTFQALKDIASDSINSIVPEKVVFAQGLVETLSGDLKELELDEKKTILLRQSFSDYQKAILFNLFAKTYANKFKRAEKAQSCFDETLAIYPEYENAIMAKAQLISTYDSENGIALVRIVLANNPNHEEVFFRLGYCLGKLDKYVEAIEQYRKAIETGPNYAAIHNNIGWSLNKVGRYEEAIEEYKKAIEIDHKFVLAYNNLGANLDKVGRREDAIEQYKKALEIDPKFISAYSNLGNTLQNLGRHKEAIEQYKKAIEIDPKNIYAYNNLGISLKNLGFHKEAVDQYEKVVEIDPKYVWAYTNCGDSLEKLGRHEEAIKYYKKAIELDPKCVVAYNNWGASLTKLSRKKDAIEQFKKAIEIDAKYILAYNNLGITLHNLNHNEEAIEQYRKAIIIDPNCIDTYINLGNILIDLSRNSEAIELYKKIIEINPKCAKAYNKWGLSLDKLGHYEQAIEQYEKAIEIDSKYIAAYNNWCHSLKKLDRQEESIELYKKVVEIDPNDVTTYNNWGDTLRVMGRYNEAIEQYRIAITIDPKSAWAYNDRGLTYSYIGELELAISDYSKALEINPNELTYCYNIAIAKKKLNSIDTLQYIEKVQSFCANQPEPNARIFYALAGLSSVDGNSDKALEMLHQAAKKDFQFVKGCAQTDIAFENIRNTSKFQAILRVGNA